MPLFFRHERHILKICRRCPQLGRNCQSHTAGVGLDGCKYYIQCVYGPGKERSVHRNWNCIEEGCPKFLDHMMNGQGILFHELDGKEG